MSTGRVLRLPPDVAERIAAGEVVDRPCSIVKELLENSLDAQASRIEVEIVDGGRELIRITDNGFGMSREDAELCVERHATSKLRAWEDLETLGSFGFRGEALPSLAAVSRFELLTMARGESVGTRVSMEGPLARKVEVAAGPEGTRVDVRDLFWNTPARRKFLKSASAEAVAITELVARFAVLNPGVGFRLLLNGKEKLFVPSERTVAQRLADFWKLDESDLLPLNGERDGIVVEGILAKPAQNRRNRGAQVLAVNGRLIRSQTLSQAFTEGFDPLIPRGRHPYVFAHLKVDPAALDVNIHPTKAEVRFANDRGPFRALYYAIKESLEAETAETLHLGAWESVLDGEGKSPGENVRRDSYGDPVPFSPPLPLVTGRAPSRSASSTMARVSDSARPAPASRVMELYRPPLPFDDEFEAGEAATGTPPPKPPAPEQLPLEPAVVRTQPRLRYLSSLYRSYLVMDVDGELWVIDQHAAHERIQYERLHRFQILGPESQGLVIPLSIPLSAVERELLTTQRERFAEVGFSIELQDDNALLTAVPPGLPGGKVAAFFSELLSDMSEEGLTTETPVAQYRERLRAMMACKSSVRARENVSETEALRLVADLIEAERSPYCPHGRPTRIRLDLTALERLFHRS